MASSPGRTKSCQHHRTLEADPCPIQLSGERQMVLEGRLSDQGVKDLVKLCPES